MEPFGSRVLPFSYSLEPLGCKVYKKLIFTKPSRQLATLTDISSIMPPLLTFLLLHHSPEIILDVQVEEAIWRRCYYLGYVMGPLLHA